MVRKASEYMNVSLIGSRPAESQIKEEVFAERADKHREGISFERPKQDSVVGRHDLL